tara:strand:+ start:14668 stop:16842 length:2175 start_codon:yes stop_codon:yes gene_type:complete
MKLWRFVLLVVVVYLSVKTSYATNGFDPQNFAIKDEASLEDFNLKAGNKEARSFGNSHDLSEDNPLYREILGHFQSRYQQIGKDQIAAINNGKKLSVTGGLNHVGISYHKPFANFSVNFNRQVAPDLFHDTRWIVTDTMDIYIDAQKLLTNMSDHDVIDIDEKQYALFAGITFKRTYRYVHFAESYEKGLAFNLDNLFLGFTNFRSKNFLEMQPYEFMTKEDSLSFSAGGVGAIPLGYGFNASAGVLVQFEKLSKVEVQSIGIEDNGEEGEFLRVSYEKEKSKKVGASASLVYDFLGLLRISLLRYDFSLEKKSSKRINLRFLESDKEELQSKGTLAKNVHNMLRLKDPKSEVIQDYVVSKEERESEIRNSKYSALIIGGYKKQKTQMVNIEKDGILKTFFTHNFEKTKYVENLWSKIFGIVLKSFLKLDSVVNKTFTDTKSFRVEYESVENLVKSKGDIDLTSESEKLSINFVRDYYAFNTTKGLGSRHRKKIVDVANRFSGLDPLIIDYIEDKRIVGPLNLEINYVVGKDGINYFNHLTVNNVYDLIKENCDGEAKGIFKFFRSLFSSCKKKLQRKYDRYLEERDADDYTKEVYELCRKKVKKYYKKKRRRFRFLSFRKKYMIKSCIKKNTIRDRDIALKQVPLWRYQEFMQAVFDKSSHKASLFNYFGYQNVYQNGQLMARDTEDNSFVRYFSEGVFKGTGLVDNYLRSQQVRSPASISVN